MVSLINKQLLLTAYAYLFITEQQKAQQGSEAAQIQVKNTEPAVVAETRKLTTKDLGDALQTAKARLEGEYKEFAKLQKQGETTESYDARMALQTPIGHALGGIAQLQAQLYEIKQSKSNGKAGSPVLSGGSKMTSASGSKAGPTLEEILGLLQANQLVYLRELAKYGTWEQPGEAAAVSGLVEIAMCVNELNDEHFWNSRKDGQGRALKRVKPLLEVAIKQYGKALASGGGPVTRKLRDFFAPIIHRAHISMDETLRKLLAKQDVVEQDVSLVKYIEQALQTL